MPTSDVFGSYPIPYPKREFLSDEDGNDNDKQESKARERQNNQQNRNSNNDMDQPPSKRVRLAGGNNGGKPGGGSGGGNGGSGVPVSYHHQVKILFLFTRYYISNNIPFS